MVEGECKTVYETILMKEKHAHIKEQQDSRKTCKKVYTNFINDKKFQSGLIDYKDTKPKNDDSL